jgi:ParB/RepB/Spo0J family partition protein
MKLITTLRMSEVIPNPNQPRKHFNEESLNELAQSILNDGLQEAILVRPYGAKYEIVQGERRYRANQIAGFDTIQVKIKNLTDEDAFHLSVIENIQREQMTPIEEAQAFLKYSELGMTHEEIAKKISKPRDYVTSKLRLLKLSESVQNMIIRGYIKEGHAKQLLRLRTILERICTEKYTIVTATQDLFDLFQEKFTHHFWDKESITVADVKKWVEQWHYALVFSSIRQSLTFGSASLYRNIQRFQTGLSIDMFCHLYGNRFDNLTEEDIEFASEFEKELLKHSYDKQFRKWDIDKFYDSIRYKENPFSKETIEWINPSNYRFVMMIDAARNKRIQEDGTFQIVDDAHVYHSLIEEINTNKDTRTEFFTLMYGMYANHSDASFLPQTIKEFYEADEYMCEMGCMDFNDFLYTNSSSPCYESLLRMRLLIEQCHRIQESEDKPRMTNHQLAEMLIVNFKKDTGNNVSYELALDTVESALAIQISQEEINARLDEADREEN